MHTYLKDAYPRLRNTPDKHFASAVISHHSERNKWAQNIIMEMTAVMLNTKFYLYSTAGWAELIVNSDLYPFWSRRDTFRNYPRTVSTALIPDLTDQSMYINHKNRNHFQTCHTGLK